jgi:hypothetical protein
MEDGLFLYLPLSTDVRHKLVAQGSELKWTAKEEADTDD